MANISREFTTRHSRNYRLQMVLPEPHRICIGEISVYTRRPTVSSRRCGIFSENAAPTEYYRREINRVPRKCCATAGTRFVRTFRPSPTERQKRNGLLQPKRFRDILSWNISIGIQILERQRVLSRRKHTGPGASGGCMLRIEGAQDARARKPAIGWICRIFLSESFADTSSQTD